MENLIDLNFKIIPLQNFNHSIGLKYQKNKNFSINLNFFKAS